MSEVDRSLNLRFFDLDVSLTSSDSSIIEPFLRLYSAFEAKTGDGQAPRVLRLNYIAATSPIEGGILSIDGVDWPITKSMCSSGAIYEFILKCLYESIQSHLLVHASAVEINGMGILLVGNSGFGKSTLALSLVNRGAGFLSDEVGAINRSTGLIEAFPRRLRLRSESLELANIVVDDFSSRSWYGKLLVDIEDVRIGAVAGPTPIGAVVFLGNDEPFTRSSSGEAATVFEFLLDRSEPDLVPFAETLEGVISVSCWESDGFTTMAIRGSGLGEAIVRIESYCQRRRICVLDASIPVETAASFEGMPSLSSLKAKYALGALVQQFLPGRNSCILRDEFQGQSPRLLLEMIRLFRGVPFYRLAVGDLSQMIGFVERIPCAGSGDPTSSGLPHLTEEDGK